MKKRKKKHDIMYETPPTLEASTFLKATLSFLSPFIIILYIVYIKLEMCKSV